MSSNLSLDDTTLFLTSIFLLPYLESLYNQASLLYLYQFKINKIKNVACLPDKLCFLLITSSVWGKHIYVFSAVIGLWRVFFKMAE